MRYPLLAMAIAAVSVVSSPVQAEDAVTAGEFDAPTAVEVCDAYGPGFTRLKGTNTCVRVGGRIRFDKTFTSRSNARGGRTQLEFETRSD